MTKDERDKIIIDSIPQIKMMAYFLSRRLDYRFEADDLFSEGIIGLIKLVDKGEYNPEEGINFQTYASKRIMGAMIDYVRNKNDISRVGFEKLKNIDNKINNNEKLTYEETRLYNFKHHLYIDEEISDGSDLNDFLANSDLNPELIYLESEESYRVIDAINEILDEKESKIIFLRYYEDMRFKDIGKIYGINESAVSQRHNNILKKLKKYIENEEQIIKEKEQAAKILYKINKKYNIQDKNNSNQIDARIYGPILKVIRKSLNLTRPQVSRLLEGRGVKYSEEQLRCFESYMFKTIKRNIFIALCSIYKLDHEEGV